MLSHFDELLVSTANDGASATIGLCPNRNVPEIDDLMDAWFKERQECIEVGLFLDEARHLLKRLVSEDEISTQNRRRVKRLLLAINASRRQHKRAE